jgi:hypothetical protein
VGNNKHINALVQLLGVITDAEEIITDLHRTYPACVNVANADMVEGGSS